MLTEQAKRIFQKYLRRDINGNVIESVETSFERVAMAIATYDYHPGKFYPFLHRVMHNLEWVPNRPAWFGAGRTGLTSACTFFEMEDSFIDGADSIVNTLKKALSAQQLGSGVGWGVSNLRPPGDIVRSTGGRATGPLEFIKSFVPILKTVQQGGYLQGANNVALHSDYPDQKELLRFINAKLDENSLSVFNTNLLVTDSFMENPDPVVWNALIHAMWVNGGIGVQFIDTANRHNAIPGYGPLQGTNPCSEFFLFSSESCQPGYINMTKFVKQGKVNWDKLAKTVRIATRAMDDLIDANHYIPSVPEMSRIAKQTRRMGNGITGFADMLVLMGIKYGSDESVDLVGQLYEFILYHSMLESEKLAVERGAFPLFEDSIYAYGEWEKPRPWNKEHYDFNRPYLDWEIVERHLPDGIRNCGFTVAAPSSFGSQTMSTEGYGIEPIFAPGYVRNFGDGSQAIEGTALTRYPAFVAAHELNIVEHLSIVASAQAFITESISKTVNMPYDATEADVEFAVSYAWENGIKNIIVYRAQSREEEPLVACKECSKVPEDEIVFQVL